MHALGFRDRRDAGEQLAAALSRHARENPLVLALPRGGVPVAYEVARALDADLDVLVARKLGAPHHPEFGVGAIAPGVRVLDERSLALLGIDPTQMAEVEKAERREMARREQRYRGDAPAPRVAGRVVIVVDDGLATGVTARAALRSARREGPARLVLAVPVGAPETVEAMRAECDLVVCLSQPEDFRAVGVWYDRFDQTSDEEVLDLLGRLRHHREART